MSASTTLDPPSSQPITHRILEVVAARKGVDVSELEPRLYDAIEPDALNRLLAETNDVPVSITFEYAGHDVTAASDGSLEVE